MSTLPNNPEKNSLKNFKQFKEECKAQADYHEQPYLINHDIDTENQLNKEARDILEFFAGAEDPDFEKIPKIQNLIMLLSSFYLRKACSIEVEIVDWNTLETLRHHLDQCHDFRKLKNELTAKSQTKAA